MPEPPKGPVAGEPTSALLPYTRHAIGATDRSAVLRALDSEALARGPEGERFEYALAEASGVPHAVAVSSGTAALILALRALGVRPGDEVIVPSLTFVATASAVVLCGATPRFVDVEGDTLTLDPEQVARAVGPATVGAIPVHFAGHPAAIEPIRAALGPGRFVLEDACHALGASSFGRPAGSLGDAACFSFHPAKVITTGEGGAVVTRDRELAARVRRLREHGLERQPERFVGLGLPAGLAAEECGAWVYEQHAFSSNDRLPELSAALGSSQLRRLPERVERRRKWAEWYQQALCGCEALRLPREAAGQCSAWHLYAVRLRRDRTRVGRAALFESLRRHGIGVQVHYVPVHLQPAFRRRFGTHWGQLPVTEEAYLGLLSLPLFPELTTTDAARVVALLCSELGCNP
ncbi:DegT/DnrJ/EryC1/StrS aminotransferase family protein [Myxococcota bacterium]|nr:DegT/DnrJ/EryC1/StrS aminotransferase family protein [Myxococcota bacterium]